MAPAARAGRAPPGRGGGHCQLSGRWSGHRAVTDSEGAAADPAPAAARAAGGPGAAASLSARHRAQAE